jgi:hypothetical protein
MSQTQICKGVATSIMATGERLSVRYHNTIVVDREPDGTIVLDSGGWRTATTKLRMNQAANQFGLGFYVSQRKGDWFVTLRCGTELPFHDGITFVPR